ncbi:MAG TPA: hypothetical protein VMH87_00695 [Pseudomonadales bacterium]|nr:hypothetical protein [Pseudomonadales bacterium]
MADSADQALNILIKLGVVGEKDAEAVKQLLQDTAKSAQTVGQESAGAADKTSGFTKEMGKLADSTGELDLKKRELLESMRMVTAQFPMLGEAARTFFSPTTASIFLIIGAFALWKNRVEEMAQSLGAIQLPDFSESIRDAQNGASAWQGMAKAVQDADNAFSSIEQTQARGLKNINDQIEAERKLLEAQKALAEARLDQERAMGGMSKEQYDAEKGAIDQGYTDKTINLGINARNAELNERKISQKKEQDEASSNAAKADALTKKYGLGETDDEFNANKDAQKAINKARQDSIDQSRKNLALLNEATSDDTGSVQGAADWAKLIAHYGAGITRPGGVRDAMSTEQANINENEAAQKETSQHLAELDRVKQERDELRKKAAEGQGKAESDRLSLQGEDDPSKVGSTAWQNAQDRARMRVLDETQAVKTSTAIGKDAMDDSRSLGQFASSSRGNAQAAAQHIQDLQQVLHEHVQVANKIANLPIAQMKADIKAATDKINQLTHQTSSIAKMQ